MCRGLYAGGRWIRTTGPPHERTGFCCGRRIAGPNGGSQKELYLMRYRWFESISLQRGVSNELADCRLPGTSGDLARDAHVRCILEAVLAANQTAGGAA